MGKTIFVLTDNDRNPISDSITVTLTKTTTPFTIFTGTRIPSIGNNNGARVFTNVTDGDYTVKYDGNTNSDLSPLHVAGPGTVINSTIGNNEVNTIHLVDGCITTIKIADLNVTTDKLDNLAVTAGKIAAGAVSGSSLADGSITKVKLSSDIFASSMEDVSGWGVKVDEITISKATGTVKVPVGGIGTNEIADNAIVESKIGTGAITTNKIGNGAVGSDQIADGSISADKIVSNAITEVKIADGAVTITKIVDGSISTAKLSNEAVTEGKIGTEAVTGSKIGVGAIGIEKLDVPLKNSMLRFPTNVAFVSPEFSDNVAPYFDNILSAYAWIDDNKGTIYIYPGTYTTPILMGEAVNLIGMDKTRCILDIVADADEPYGIKITATSEPFMIKNLTIKARTTGYLGTGIYGIWIDSVGADFVRIEDCLIFCKPAIEQVQSDFCTALYINEANFRVERCFIQAHSANYGSVWEGAGVHAVRLAGTTVGVFSDCQFSVKAYCGGTIDVYGISWTSSSQDVDVSNCTFEITETGTSTNVYTFVADSAITPLIMNSLFSKSNHVNVTPTLIQCTQSAGVKVKDAM